MTTLDLLDHASEFEAQQRRRCRDLGIDVPDRISHLAVRTRSWAAYVNAREKLESRCLANLENVWNGRPISKILLDEPLALEGGRTVDLVELIPPPHQRVYKMGLEHVGYVVFDDYTHVKFYARSLMDYCLQEGATFTSIIHAAWSPTDPQAGPYALA